jgi:membrane-bound serine protease (ClpP class)
MAPFRFPVLRLVLLALATLALGLQWADAQKSRAHVYVIPVDGVIDLGLAPFIARVIDEAKADGAAAIVLDINTFGGRVDAAVAIRDSLLTAEVPVFAFINKRAISAGALIALASDKIFMAEGGTIGAATPVQGGMPGAAAQPVEEKTVSYLRKEFRSTAEARGRPPELAEAMVDADVAVEGVIEKGKLLTLTTDEALEQKFVEHRADTLDALLAIAELGGAEVRNVQPTWAESVVRFLTHPVVSSLLITIGLLGIITEIRTPGFGFPGAFGLLAFGLFFWGQWIVQLAGLEELLLVGVGVLLLLVEVFITPGFGVLGLLGIGAMLAGLGMALFGPGATSVVIVAALTRVMLSLLLAIIAALAILRVLPKLPVGRRLVLAEGLTADAGYSSAPESDMHWLGRRGTTVTPLHPSGIVAIEGARVDVVSDGEFIDAEVAVEVVKVDGNRIVVRKLQAQG